MSQSDGFLGGFLLGTLVGGITGGVLGVVVASKLANRETAEQSFRPREDKGRKQKFSPTTEQGIESARRGLEDKIAQLNDAIDDVRQQLSSVNGSADPSSEDAIASD